MLAGARPHLPAPLRRARRAARPWCSPPTTAPTPPRSTSPTPARRSPRSSTPGRRRRRGWPRVRAARHRGAHAGRWSTGTSGSDRVTHAHVAALRRRRGRRRHGIACDLLLVCGGWNPAVHLFSQARGRLRYDDGARRLPARRATSTGLSVAGSAGGVFDLGGVPRRRAASGPRGTDRLGLDAGASRTAGRVESGTSRRPALVLWRVPDPAEPARPHPVRRPAARRDGRRHRRAPPAPGCARSSTSSATRPSAPPTTRARPPASSPPASSPRRSACRVGETGHDDVPAAVHAGGLRRPGRPRPRAPATTRSGSRRSTTGTSRPAPCSRTSGSGSAPWYYPQPGEDMEAAVLRECAGGPRRRRHHGRLHAGQDRRAGPDAGVLLDRLYTNLMSSLKVGSRPLRRDVRGRRHGHRRRHGDAPGRRPVPASPRRPATRRTILDWMEEWLQTEWPRPAGALHLGHRAVGHLPAGRPAVARRPRRRSPPTSTSPTRRSRS